MKKAILFTIILIIFVPFSSFSMSKADVIVFLEKLDQKKIKTIKVSSVNNTQLTHRKGNIISINSNTYKKFGKRAFSLKGKNYFVMIPYSKVSLLFYELNLNTAFIIIQ